MYKQLTTLCLLAFSLGQAQELNTELLQDLKPRNIGPGGMSGRITAIDVVHKQPDIIYAGSASGGLWKSTSGGIDWEPIFNEEVTASIGAVAIQQSNPSVIWVGTGEGNPRNSLNGGYGIYRSLDAGRSWQLMGLEKTRHIHRIIIDPTDPNTIYAGAIGSPWGEHPERGVFKTTDGGKTWNKILFVNERTGVADMVMDPSNPNKIVVAMWEHKRDPWFFKSGGPGSGIYMTHDGGVNWKKLTEEEGLPKGDLGRIGVAIPRNKPNVVYALIESKKNALYRSDDGGFSWKMVNDKEDIGNRPFYYSEIYVDPENENRVFSIFTYVNVSEDGGKSFSQLMPAYSVSNGVHPDHHAWWIHPENGQYMIDGNDGGLNITKDGGKSWRFIGNLPVGQFYHVAVDNDFPYNVYGGMQDNGSWKGPAYVWRDQGIRNSYWQEISFGDGFDVVPDPTDSNYGWSMSQEGFVGRYDAKTGNNYIVRPTAADPEEKLRFNWNSAINIDPFDSNTLYFGSQYVHKSTDGGLTWEIISPDLTTNDPEKQKQHESGGLTMDATGAENYCTVLVIEPSPLEKGTLWVGSDDGRLHLSRDGGKSWTDLSKNVKGMPAGAWIPQIKASNKRAGEALLVVNDYRRFNYEPYLFRTKDYGKSWSRLVDAADVKSYVLSVVEDSHNDNLLFLGTDDGLYMSLNAGANWQKWGEGFPTVPVNDMVIHPREQDLVIGTFGRAFWILDDIGPLRSVAGNGDLLNKQIHLFNPPTSYIAAYQQPSGSRFGADAEYNGENRPEGAMITYYLHKKEEEKKAKEDKKEDDEINADEAENKVKWDSISLKIYEGDRLIRTLKEKAPEKNGFHRIYWARDEKGIDPPSRSPKERKTEPGGVLVKPGTYRLLLEYGDQKAESQIEVRWDPRLNKSTTAIQEQYEASKRLEGYAKTASEAVRQLVDSKKAVEEINQKLKAKDEKAYKETIKSGKEIGKQIDSLVALYIGKEDKRQGITEDPDISVMQRINTASYYVQSRPDGLTTTENKLIGWAQQKLAKAVEQTNAFYQNEWESYKKEMEALQLSPFKEEKVIKIY